MEALEKRAHEEYWATPVGMDKELVALGIEDGDAYVWFELPNTADVNPDGRGEFYVDGLVMRDVLIAAAKQLGHVRLGEDTRRGVDAMLRERVVVLWHTHTATTHPSREDIDEFPTWLATAGMVYHVPTGTTTVYNECGIISPLSMLGPSSNATSKDV